MSSVEDVDVAIIGAGTAGLSAYSEVRKATKQLVLINGGPAGTMCARVGCMPSKVLIPVANDFHHRHRFAREGIVGEEQLRIDHSRVLAYSVCAFPAGPSRPRRAPTHFLSRLNSCFSSSYWP